MHVCKYTYTGMNIFISHLGINLTHYSVPFWYVSLYFLYMVIVAASESSGQPI